MMISKAQGLLNGLNLLYLNNRKIAIKPSGSPQWRGISQPVVWSSLTMSISLCAVLNILAHASVVSSDDQYPADEYGMNAARSYQYTDWLFRRASQVASKIALVLSWKGLE